MAVNRGKDFEGKVREAFDRVNDVSIDRLHDNTMGFKDVAGICDFIVYRFPYEYYLECKSVHNNRLSIHSNPKPDRLGKLHGFYGNITDTQWSGLLEKSHIPGVIASGVLCWWIDRDITIFMPIKLLQWARDNGFVSVPYNFMDLWQYGDDPELQPIVFYGTKKRVFFDYDAERFLTDVASIRGCSK